MDHNPIVNATYYKCVKPNAMKHFLYFISGILFSCSFVNQARAQFPNDFGVVALINPVSGCNLSIATVTIRIGNFGTSPQGYSPVSYSVNGGMVVTEICPITLPPGCTLDYTFAQPAYISAPGIYIFVVTLGPDNNNANNTMQFTVQNGQYITSFPYFEKFEGFACWTSGGLASIDNWELGTPSQNSLNGAHSGTMCWMTDLNSNYTNNTNCYLESPGFDFTNLAEPTLSVWLNIKTQEDLDAMILESSENGGPWIPLIADSGFYNNNSVLGYFGPPKWSGNSIGWRHYKTSLSYLAGKANLRFRFNFASDGTINDEGIAIDDFSINDKGPDLLLKRILELLGNCGSNPLPVKISVQNVGSLPSNGFIARMKTDNLPYTYDTIQDTLIPGQEKDFTLSNLANVFMSGPHNLLVAVKDSNDFNTTNDSLISLIFSVDPMPLPPVLFDFENPGFTQFLGISHGTQAAASVEVGLGVNGTYAIVLTGGDADTWPAGSGNSTTYEQAFAYQDHISTLYTCDVSLAGMNTWAFYFDLKQTFSGGPKTSWLRVVKDDTITLPEMFTSDTALNPTTATNDPFLPRYYMLSGFQPVFHLKIQASNRLNSANSPNLIGDKSIIDNIQIHFFEGIKDSRELSVLIYPNPAADFLNVQLSKSIDRAVAEVRNMQGQLLLSTLINGKQKFSLDLKSLPDGVYTLLIKNNDFIQTLKFIRTGQNR